MQYLSFYQIMLMQRSHNICNGKQNTKSAKLHHHGSIMYDTIINKSADALFVTLKPVNEISIYNKITFLIMSPPTSSYIDIFHSDPPLKSTRKKLPLSCFVLVIFSIPFFVTSRAIICATFQFRSKNTTHISALIKF